MTEPLGLAAAALGIREGSISSLEVVRDCIRRMAEWEPHIQAMVAVFEEEAEDAARTADLDVASGQFRGPMHGVPVVVKDLIDVAGKPTEAGSAVLAGNIAKKDAKVVTNLLEAGAIILGKSNTHEFAYGALTPPTRNPWNTDRMAGGSSGGSAAALAAGEVPGALGSDTAGSIREPAALCGIVGLKPTFGAVSCEGVVPLAWSLDVVGPMTRSTEDGRLLFGAMAGVDHRDLETTPPLSIGDGKPRIGVVVDLLDLLEPAVELAVTRVFDSLSDAGAEVTEVRLAEPDEVIAVVFVILASEASAYHRARLTSMPDAYGDDVRAYLEMGMDLLAVDYVDAQRVRTVYRSTVAKALREHDYLLAPAQQVAAPLPDVDTVEFPGGRTAPRDLTLIRPLSLFSLTGNPAVSVPISFSQAGLPIGIQLIGRAFHDVDLLAAAGGIQTLMGWEPQLPSLPN